MAPLRALLEDRSVNAGLGWLLVAAVALAGVASVVRGDLLWGVYAAAIVAVALVPTVRARDRTAMVTWEALALAAAPVVVQLAGLAAESLTYLSVAALALLVVVEIEAFTDARMSHGFAVVFAVLTTLTVASFWAVVQFASDAALGTEFLTGRVDLMWDLVAAAVVGIGAGALFELYFRHEESLPGEGM